MKRILRYAIYAVAAVLLAACAKDELPVSEAGGDAPQFAVTVSDGGYAPSASARTSAATGGSPSTRAAESGYATTFTAGDRIGVFAVKDKAIVSGVDNLCLTAKTGNGSLVWQDDTGKALLSFTGATYYAYYPYRSDLPDKPVPTATDAAGFFDKVITAWTPATDQSTYAKYTAQDLMTAQGTLSGNSLSFSMAHKMALVVIDLPRTKYTFTNTSPTVPDYFIDAPGTQFTGFSPCRMADGTYRYLLNPLTTNGSLNGSYTMQNDKQSKWSLPLADNVTAGNYKVFKVDGGSSTIVTTKTHTLQVGDFYMSDGSLLAKSTENLIDAQKQACIGVVFWVGDATAKDGTLKTDHKDCTHGLVVALKDAIAGTTTWQDPYTFVQNWLNSNQSGKFLSVASFTGANDPLNNIQGYNNTKAIEAFNAANSDYAVQAVQNAVAYRNAVSAPATSSGWYLPSEKELTLLCGKEVSDIYQNNSGGTDMRDFLNGTSGPFNKLGSSNATAILSAGYWSSTESSYDSYDAFDVYFDSGDVNDNIKDRNDYRVRCVLAF